MVAAVVFASGARADCLVAAFGAWLALLALLGFLMVSTWRYYSFKGINLNKPYTPLLIIVLGGLIYAIWNWPQPVLLGHGHRLRGQRHRDPHRRHRAPPLAARRRHLTLRSIRLADPNDIALVGSESLLGREVRDIVATIGAGPRICASSPPTTKSPARSRASATSPRWSTA